MGDPKTASGQEPVSGSQGQGTADAPFDQGNQEDNVALAGRSAPKTGEPQLASPDKAQSGQEPISGRQGQGTAGEPFDQGNQEDTADLAGKAPQHTGAPKQAPSLTLPVFEFLQSSSSTPDQLMKPNDASTSAETSSPEQIAPLTKKPNIRSSGLFTNADPFTRRTSLSGATNLHNVDPKAKIQIEEQATEGAAKTEGEDGAKELQIGKDIPPSASDTIVEPACTPRSAEDGQSIHLGEAVPPGMAAVTVDKGKGKARAIDTDDINSDASNRSQLTREESTSTETGYTRRTYSTAGTGASSISSRTQSFIQQSGRIPTAGGVPLGARAAADRQHRLDTFIPENEASSSSSRLGTIEYYGLSKSARPARQATEGTQDVGAGATNTTSIGAHAAKSADEEKIARRASKKVKGFRRSISKAFKGREGSQ